jgi:ferrous iron transport protein A
LTGTQHRFHTEVIVQLSFKKGGRSPKSPATLAELKQGEQGILERIDLPADVAQRLMELGFLPGVPVTRARSAPGGDPRVFRVDGSEIALRRETAARLFLRAAVEIS